MSPYSNSKPLLATGGYDYTINLMQPFDEPDNEGRTLQHRNSHVNALAINPKGTILAAAGHRRIRLYDITIDHEFPMVDLENMARNVTRVGFWEDGKWMYSSGEDGRVRIWDINELSPICSREFNSISEANAVWLHPNQVELAIGTQEGYVLLWDIRTEFPEHIIPEKEASIQDICISPNGAYMAVVNNKGNCYIWDFRKSATGTSQLVLTFPALRIQAHSRYALRCRFSPDSSLMATCAGDGSAKVYRTDTFTQHAEFKVGKGWVWGVAFSNDSKYLFTVSSDGLARLCNIETQLVDLEFLGHVKAATALVFRDTTTNGSDRGNPDKEEELKDTASGSTKSNSTDGSASGIV